jgi:hypothetical protein
MHNLLTRLRDLFGDPFAHVDTPSTAAIADYLDQVCHPGPGQ